jgi:curved DNA-binding protein CbpA
MKDYYSILGLNRHADASEIKRAYRGLAVKYHPDKNPDPAVENLFKEINEAYTTLSDPEKKFFYDQQYKAKHREDESVTGRTHRDPAYKRKAPLNFKPTPKVTVSDLIYQYVDYVKWLAYAAFVISCIWVLDYVLPYQIYDEQIINVYAVQGMQLRSRSTFYRYDVIFTSSGKEIRVYNQMARHFNDDVSLKLASTPILNTYMQIANDSYTTVIPLGYIYNSTMALVPLSLFIISGLAVLFRQHKEFLFNASIACGVLNMIVLYFIFTV